MIGIHCGKYITFVTTVNSCTPAFVVPFCGILYQLMKLTYSQNRCFEGSWELNRSHSSYYKCNIKMILKLILLKYCCFNLCLLVHFLCGLKCQKDQGVWCQSSGLPSSHYSSPKSHLSAFLAALLI